MKKLLAAIRILLAVTISFMTVTVANAEEYEVTKSSLHLTAKRNTELRLYAMDDGPSYATLLKGESVEVLTLYPDSKGQLWGSVLRDENDSQFRYGYLLMADMRTSKRVAKLSEIMRITGNTVNVRDTPSITGDKLSLLYKGDIVAVEKYVPTSDGRIWAECFTENGEKYLGWVSIKYLASAEEN